MGTESEGLGTQDMEANTELRYLAFSRKESPVMPLKEREGMEKEHIQETEEEGDEFESSPVSGHTLLVGFVE